MIKVNDAHKNAPANYKNAFLSIFCCGNQEAFVTFDQVLTVNKTNSRNECYTYFLPQKNKNASMKNCSNVNYCAFKNSVGNESCCQIKVHLVSFSLIISSYCQALILIFQFNNTHVGNCIRLSAVL